MRRAWLVAVVVPAWSCAVVQAQAVSTPHSMANAVASEPDQDLEEVIFVRPEPRYVAPTRRDRIGRIWAPVYINEQGPFRLVLDTGATHTSIMPTVADKLGLQPDSHRVRVRGTTGSAVVDTVKVDSVQMGDLLLRSRRLPVIKDALGGAEGVIGNEGLADRRVHIDFRSDFVLIRKSHREPAPPGYYTLRVKLVSGRLLMVPAQIGSVAVDAIIDTGSQVTVANVAARDALSSYLRQHTQSRDSIVGVTLETMIGDGFPVPPLVLGDVRIHTQRMTFLDLDVFKAWKMTERPVVVVGMDALGLLDVLIIDYARGEVQMLLRR